MNEQNLTGLSNSQLVFHIEQIGTSLSLTIRYNRRTRINLDIQQGCMPCFYSH